MSIFTEAASQGHPRQGRRAVQGRRMHGDADRRRRRQHPLRPQQRVHQRHRRATPTWRCRWPSASASASRRSTSSTTRRWNAWCAAPRNWRGWRRRTRSSCRRSRSRPTSRRPTFDASDRGDHAGIPRPGRGRLDRARAGGKLVAAGFLDRRRRASPRSPTARATSATSRPPTSTTPAPCAPRTARGSGWVGRNVDATSHEFDADARHPHRASQGQGLGRAPRRWSRASTR